MTTPLQHRLISMINDQGPMGLDRFMGLCLADPEHGYYRNADPLGAAGDFTTAPEISQMFGELISLWLYDDALKQDIADDAVLVELGPGRGTLMADALRCLERIAPGKNWPVHLMEISPGLKQAQHKSLASCANATVDWIDGLEALPPKPLLIIANEFFDALPIRQFRSQNGQWHERKIGLDHGELALTVDPAPAGIDHLPPATDEGTVAEIAPDLPAMITTLSSHLNQYGGAMLVIDYGKSSPLGDSLQAVQKHHPVDILHEPGSTDLSAWVDFSAIATHARNSNAAAYGPVEQGLFLKSIGLYARAEQLAAGADAETRRQIAAAVDRLSSPAQMGTAFKVMAIRPQHASMPVAGL